MRHYKERLLIVMISHVISLCNIVAQFIVGGDGQWRHYKERLV